MKKINFAIVAGLLLSSTLQSCGYILVRPVVKKNIMNNRETSIPPDFGNDKSEVLVFELLENESPGYDKAIQKTVPKYFNGQYVFKTKAQISEMNDEDREKYRYIFSSEGRQERVEFGENIPSSRDFKLLDTKTNVSYKSNVISGMYVRVIEAYLINLEKVRVEHQGQ
mgnify:FL=1